MGVEGVRCDRDPVRCEYTADRRDTEPLAMVGHECVYHGKRGSSSRAKDELATNKISFTRFELADLPLQLFDRLRLVSSRPWAAPGVDVRPLDPTPQRVGIDPDLRTDPDHRRVRRRPWGLPAVLINEPVRPLTQLILGLLGAGTRPPFSSLTTSHRTGGGSHPPGPELPGDLGGHWILKSVSPTGQSTVYPSPASSR